MESGFTRGGLTVKLDGISLNGMEADTSGLTRKIYTLNEVEVYTWEISKKYGF